MHDTPAIPRQVAIKNGFVRLWAASTVSNLADGVGLAAAPLLAAALTRDPLLVSGLTIAQRLPWFLFTLISGALVDRFNRREVMAHANRWRFLLLVILALSLISGWINLLVLYVIYFLLGTIETLFDNAALAILPELVERERLEQANGRLYATSTLANELAGPPLGSYLFAINRAASFFVAGLAYGLSSTMIHQIPDGSSPRRTRTDGMLREIKQGVRWFWQHRLLRTLGFFAAAFNLVFAATMSVFVLYAQDVLGLSDTAYGFLLAFGAGGGIIGSLLAKRLSDRFGAGRLLLADALLSASAFIGIGLTSRVLVVGLMFVVLSMSDMFGNVVIVSLRQELIPTHLLGRVASAYRLVVLGALPLGALIGGVLARGVSLAAPFLAGGLLLISTAIAMQPAVNNRTIEAARRLAAP